MSIRPITYPSPAEGKDEYEIDFHAWLGAQREALAARDASRLDWDNLIEEIDALGSSERRELLSRLTTILEHLLKLEHGLVEEPRSGWERTVRVQRRQLNRHLSQSPSLKPFMLGSIRDLHADAREDVIESFRTYEPAMLGHYEKVVPKDLPYTIEQLLDPSFIPRPPAAR